MVEAVIGERTGKPRARDNPAAGLRGRVPGAGGELATGRL